PGSGRMTAVVRDLLIAETTTLADYDIEAALALEDSTVRDVHVDRGAVEATLRNSQLTVRRLEVDGAALAGQASGTVDLTDVYSTTLEYAVTRANLAELRTVTNQD